MTLGEWFGAIRAIWPILALIVGYELAVLMWRLLMWRALQSILASGSRLERIVLNHRHATKTGAVVVDAPGVSGAWDNGSAPNPPGSR